jgi:hypothetical protein
MISPRSLALSVVCLALAAPLIQAQDLSGYRGFRLGMTLAAVAQQSRLPVSAARLLHQRPQLIQELEWQPQRLAEAPASEAVRTVRFTFYDGRLYQIAVAYDRDRIEGLTAQDLVEAISTSYGLAILASTQIGGAPPAPPFENLSLGIDRTVTARWEDPQYSVTLVHTSYPSAFGLVLVEKQPDRLARAATAASARLDMLEAPQREISRQQKQADEDRAKAEKARGANKPVFRF